MTGLEYVEQDTFGRLSWIIPIAAVMMLADFLFFALVYSSPGGNLITAQVGLASSVIALTLSTALLYLLRTIVDGAILRVEALNLSLSRFVPAEFLRLLNRQSVEQISLGESKEATMSVLFSDIRDFTAIAEGNSPENNFKFINDYLKRMGPVIRDHNGFIDKYIGDGILALFEHADDAVRAGLAMIAELENFNRERSEPVEIGIGIHTGTHHARHNRRRASHGKHCDRRHGQLSIAH
ncbi:MAG TPA: adenylate/guanylate cyclase domain-containing protein [Leptospiraceae bacterium]|nr:adenylate/guanylate cyclase domain-containing protein [Leptospiraceae bacterium]HMW59939.1 adenylate/guanylate cyclase domain-containing protein [Leptospiraceae bacterium]HMZ36624.1 adenylate/guanylate cyclase domain-containing protein [Leptospiraceae bacterium]HNL01718.1 adenylate/guanylate cyclase domain-containing protein [Leptospiraceae bacterium]